MGDPPAAHRIVVAAVHRVPRPFHCLALRGDEPGRDELARSPWDRLHHLRTGFLDADSLQRLVADGRVCTQGLRVEAFGDVEHAPTSLQSLDTVAPLAAGWGEALAAVLAKTRVLGDDAAVYRDSLPHRIDYLVACGAGFHNDVRGHWSRCLFWLLAIDVDDVEFVMPHAGVRLPLAAGDLVVFDPAMAHGLCRPADHGQAVAASFDGHPNQLFLTGELLLGDAQWAALGSPWQPIELHRQCGALDLRVAGFDERSGTVQQLLALRDAMG